MASRERKDGLTPNGGEYSEIVYLDADHNEVDASVASEFILRELKDDGTLVGEIIGK